MKNITKTPVPPFKSEYLKDRPNFGPMQIKNAEDLKVGMKVLLCSRIGGERSESEIEILDEPYLDAPEKRMGKLICDIRVWSGHQQRLVTRKMYLEDRNVVSYPDGTWNPFCWLEKMQTKE